jgi:CubicO group peptidase (beta-lactamase class C family)
METVRVSLARDFNHQDERFSPVFSILGESITRRAFPGASVAVTHAGRLIALKAFGEFIYESDLDGPRSSSRFLRQSRPQPNEASRGGGGADVETSTLFDLASVTKAVATTTMAAILYERGMLELDAPIVTTLPEFSTDSRGAPDPRRRDVTFRMLLAHSSGLPAYEKLFLHGHSRDELLHATFTTPLAADSGTRAEYSDIGFIILGAALEHIAQESLDNFCQREIFGPLAMTHTTFNPPADIRAAIPPTADERDRADNCGASAPAGEAQNRYPVHSGSHPSNASPARSTFRNRIVQGEVQDENAFVLGGVAGHAGLFSTAEDLAQFAHSMLSGGSPVLRPETVALFTKRQSFPPTTSRALGWDTPSHPSQSGRYFGPRSFGHLGYTGTSLWIDPDRELSITLLTNRTWPDCSNQAIKQVRPRFHDAVIDALESR